MIEIAFCNHIEAVEKVPGLDLRVAECSLCGQTRKFKEGDEYYTVITKLGRINDAVVMPDAGVRLDITPEEHRMVREGWDIINAEKEGRNRNRYEQPSKKIVFEVEPEPEGNIEDVGAVEETVVSVKKHVRESKYDEKQEAILTDYEQMTVRNLERKHDMPKGAFHQLKKRWQAEGVIFPTPFADKPEASTARQHKGESKYDKHMEEILADYELMSVVKLEKKHNIPKGGFYSIRNAWERRGIIIPPPYISISEGRPRMGKELKCADCGKDIYVQKWRLDKEPDAEHRCRKCWNKKLALHNKELRGKILAGERSDGMIEVKVGQLEELLRELEYLRGYRKAMLDIFKKNKLQVVKSVEGKE